MKMLLQKLVLTLTTAFAVLELQGVWTQSCDKKIQQGRFVVNMDKLGAIFQNQISTDQVLNFAKTSPPQSCVEHSSGCDNCGMVCNINQKTCCLGGQCNCYWSKDEEDTCNRPNPLVSGSFNAQNLAFRGQSSFALYKWADKESWDEDTQEFDVTVAKKLIDGDMFVIFTVLLGTELNGTDNGHLYFVDFFAALNLKLSLLLDVLGGILFKKLGLTPEDLLKLLGDETVDEMFKIRHGMKKF